jgi:hypothetical protein
VDFVDGLEDRFEILTIVMQRVCTYRSKRTKSKKMAFVGMNKRSKCTARLNNDSIQQHCTTGHASQTSAPAPQPTAARRCFSPASSADCE